MGSVPVQEPGVTGTEPAFRLEAICFSALDRPAPDRTPER